jgi:hypothetical protein
MQFVNYLLHYNYNSFDIQLTYIKLKYEKKKKKTVIHK